MTRAMAVVLLALMAATPGFCQADEAPAQPPADDAGEAQVVVIRAVWPGADLTNTSFRVFEDQQMRSLVDIFPAPDGTAVAVLRPGEYYIMAVVDANGNNQVDADDGFGFHGVSDLSGNSQPAPAVVKEGQLNSAIIPILMIRSEDGRLVPLPSAQQRTTGTLQGTFEKGGPTPGAGPILLVVLPVGMETRPVVSVIGPHEFELRVPAGAHRVAVVVDSDDSATLSVGDLMALRGFGENEPVTVDPDGTSVIGPLTLAACTEVPAGIPPLVAGLVTGAEVAEGARTSVAFCTDQALRNEAFSVEAGSGGRFAAVADAGMYYLRATIDQAADGALGVGDMLGFFGVDSLLSGAPPRPVEVAEGALITGVEIPISARIDETGRLTAWPPSVEGAEAPGNAGE